MRADNPVRALADTNILVYAHDPTDPVKHDVARQLLSDLSGEGRLTYTVQVINEFCSRVIHPGRPPAFTSERVREIVRVIQGSGEVLPVLAATTTLALDAVISHKMSFWDALIWATARENGVTLIYTEDTPGAAEIEGVHYINPFV